MSELPVSVLIETCSEKMVTPALVAAAQHGKIMQYGSVGIRSGGVCGRYLSAQFWKESGIIIKARLGHSGGSNLWAFNRSGAEGLKSGTKGTGNVFPPLNSGMANPFPRWRLPASGDPAAHRRAVVHHGAASTPAAGRGELK